MKESSTECPACGHELSMFVVSEPDRKELAARRITSAVASWWFPSLILVGVALWASFNLIWRPVEPYPVVVLAWISAVLATVAACQGPLILLAQRRAAMHDRERDDETFRVVTNVEADLHDIREQLARLNVLKHRIDTE